MAKLNFKNYIEEFTDPTFKKPKAILIQSLKQLDEAVEECRQKGIVAFDFEASGINMFEQDYKLAGVSFACSKDKGWYCPVGHFNKPIETSVKGKKAKHEKDQGMQLSFIDALLRADEKDLTQLNVDYDYFWTKFLTLLKDPNVVTLVHNCKYELLVMEKLNLLDGYVLDHDTMAQAHLLNTGLKGLKGLSKTHLLYDQQPIETVIGYKPKSKKGPRQLKFNETDPTEEHVLQYAVDDACCTLALYYVFQKAFKKRSLGKIPWMSAEEYLRVQTLAGHAAVNQSFNTLKIDVPKLEATIKGYQTFLKEYRLILFSKFGRPWNPGSNQELLEVCLEQGFIIPPNTEVLEKEVSGGKTKSKLKVLEEVRDKESIDGLGFGQDNIAHILASMFAFYVKSDPELDQEVGDLLKTYVDDEDLLDYCIENYPEDHPLHQIFKTCYILDIRKEYTDPKKQKEEDEKEPLNLYKVFSLVPVRQCEGIPSVYPEGFDFLKWFEIFIVLRQYYRAQSTLQSFLLNRLSVVEAGMDYVRVGVDPYRTASGRFAASSVDERYKFNSQNQPASLRDLYIPKPGYCFVQSDYSQLELRIVAAISGDDGMIKSYLEGLDLHSATAAAMFHVDYDEFQKVRKDKEHPKYKQYNQYRSLAKIINFSINYGKTAYGFAKDWNMPLNEAEEFVNRYLKEKPGIHRYILDVRQKGLERGYVRTLFGRRRYFETALLFKNNYNISPVKIPKVITPQTLREIKSQEWAMRGINTVLFRRFSKEAKEMGNHPIQGTAADVVSTASGRMFLACQKEFKGARQMFQIHDELVYEVPIGMEHDFGKRLQKEMESVIVFPTKYGNLVLEAPYAVSYTNWADAK